MAELKIELISVGDEILIGQTLDTNANWIASRLSENGFRLRWISVVRDSANDLRHQLRRAWNRADVVLVTGGLGPTHDDITRPVIARFFNDEIVFKPELDKEIRERFARRNLTPPPGYEVMAEFPSRATPIPNLHGSAPGIHYEYDEKKLFAMPGVPKEMRGMFSDYVLKILNEIRHQSFSYMVVRTAGTGESHLASLIGDPADLAPVELAYLPSIDNGVTLRLSTTGIETIEDLSRLVKAYQRMEDLVGEYIYATGEDSLEEILIEQLRFKNLKLALAESCTGGLVAARIVSIPGSSDVFDRGFVTYSNKSKVELLGVDEDILERHGAVSFETAEAMAKGALDRAGADIAASVTGIAGPSGGTEEKPVGLVYIGVADRSDVDVERFRFTGDRDANHRRSAYAVLVMLWQRLKKI